MERLNLEELARLVDEQPTPEEQRILDADPRLRRELEALKTQSWSLRNLPALLPPVGGWHQLDRALSAAGLIHGQSGAAVWRRWLQVAAAVVLFVGGTAVGWFTAEAPGALQDGGGMASAEGSFVRPASLGEATELLQRKEWEYREALANYRQFWQVHAGAQTEQDPVTRLPYVEAFVAAARMAVEENPADPFFNRFLAESMEERGQLWRLISQDNWN